MRTRISVTHEQWPGDLSVRFDPKLTFVIPYGPKWGGSFVDWNKTPRDPILPYGMSGCGLWYFDADTEDSEKPVYALIGVQHSYNPHHQVLLGTLIDKMIDKIVGHCGIELSTIPLDSRS